MKARLTRKGRRRIAGILVVGIFALVAVGVSQGSAGSSRVVTPLYKNRDDCTLDPATKVVGQATFTRDGNNLTLKVTFRDAAPGGYYLYLYTGDCGTNWSLGKFKVDSSGHGSKSGTVDVSGFGDDFFAAPYDSATGNYHESDIVSVG